MDSFQNHGVYDFYATCCFETRPSYDDAPNVLADLEPLGKGSNVLFAEELVLQMHCKLVRVPVSKAHAPWVHMGLVSLDVVPNERV